MHLFLHNIAVMAFLNEIKWSCMFFIFNFYPTAHKGCRGIVFTHGVRMGGWAFG